MTPIHPSDVTPGIAPRVVFSMASYGRPSDSQWPRRTSSLWREPLRDRDEEIAGVAVAGHKAQRLLLAAAADQDRRVRLAAAASAGKGFRPAGSADPRTASPRPTTSGWAIWSVSSRRSNRSFTGGNGTPRPRCSRSNQPAPIPK